MTSALDAEVGRVLAADACSGCGACTRLDRGLEMRLDDAGYLRPVRTAPHAGPAPDAEAARRFRGVCPGVAVDAGPAAPPPGGPVPRHPTLGPVLRAWRAWAADDAVRWSGSSGGVLTALAGWLAETEGVAPVTGCAADPAEPRRTVSVTITTRAEALAASGSRYAPVAAAAGPAAEAPSGAFVGKPCEASAVRGLAATSGATAPLVLSFFCAGTPSQHATDAVLASLGAPPDADLVRLRYRGEGWPGSFTAQDAAGATWSTSYDASWGAHLGKAVQWRCKICPDGVGESSDVTAGDLWRTDERGYPTFTEGDGTSALLARTPRGLDAVLRAIEAGVIVAEPVELDEVAAVQPLQRTRRATLAGRLLGARLAGRPVPRYRGFGLVRLALAQPRAAVRAGRGTFRRLRSARAGGATPAPGVPVPTGPAGDRDGPGGPA